LCAVLAAVDPIPRTEHDPRFPDPTTQILVVTEIPGREAKHSRVWIDHEISAFARAKTAPDYYD
jgi:hypothetical protein